MKTIYIHYDHYGRIIDFSDEPQVRQEIGDGFVKVTVSYSTTPAYTMELQKFTNSGEWVPFKYNPPCPFCGK